MSQVDDFLGDLSDQGGEGTYDDEFERLMEDAEESMVATIDKAMTLEELELYDAAAEQYQEHEDTQDQDTLISQQTSQMGAVPDTVSKTAESQTEENQGDFLLLLPADLAAFASTLRQEDLFVRPVAPKKPVSGYFQYMQDHRERFKQDNPSAGVAELTKGLSIAWNALDAESKEQYDERTKALKASYIEAYQAYTQHEQVRKYMLKFLGREEEVINDIEDKDIFPLARVRTIVSLDKEVGNVTKDALLLIGKAAEGFVVQLGDLLSMYIVRNNTKQVKPDALHSLIQKTPYLQFLKSCPEIYGESKAAVPTSSALQKFGSATSGSKGGASVFDFQPGGSFTSSTSSSSSSSSIKKAKKSRVVEKKVTKSKSSRKSSNDTEHIDRIDSIANNNNDDDIMQYMSDEEISHKNHAGFTQEMNEPSQMIQTNTKKSSKASKEGQSSKPSVQTDTKEKNKMAMFKMLSRQTELVHQEIANGTYEAKQKELHSMLEKTIPKKQTNTRKRKNTAIDAETDKYAEDAYGNRILLEEEDTSLQLSQSDTQEEVVQTNKRTKEVDTTSKLYTIDHNDSDEEY